ncbi:uncharacterized protein F5147DRAFT_657559 [Suillus discolor]|uniref:alpha,alpha-trehalase n=1 Tax=Suillus discolor TaxID=1912936 RepID=A0A9P7EVP3_9AGAM|nr:uncharacterized protein F5147DRAFT_657559 [Suillus discolor]KAG2092951.1 hypothetical protein F5147DRAFT_657559 [Suillus discolor]
MTQLLLRPLMDGQGAELYSELASGAETRWDYSSCVEAIPHLGNPGLRLFNVKNNISICLNSILFDGNFGMTDKAKLPLAELYSMLNATASSNHLQVTTGIREGILDLLWDPAKLAFYDFNLTLNACNDIFMAATHYPVVDDIIPNKVLTFQSHAFGYNDLMTHILQGHPELLAPTAVQDYECCFAFIKAWSLEEFMVPNDIRECLIM